MIRAGKLLTMCAQDKLSRCAPRTGCHDVRPAQVVTRAREDSYHNVRPGGALECSPALQRWESA